jgi:integral membrane protein
VVDRGLLVRYRVMAFSTATLLIILVFVGIPLQVAAGRPEVVNVVGTIHGFLYLVYLFVAFQLTRRLGIPKWQMALVLVAGTVPFAAFVAERKMTRRFEAEGALGKPVAGEQVAGSTPSARSSSSARLRQRWLSPRAMLLHLEVAVIAPGCAVAGWWQATRALAGNGLSWVYSIEWPVFALLAIAGWWYLIHEDPEAYNARRRRPARGGNQSQAVALTGPSAGGAPALAEEHEVTVDRPVARLARILGMLVGFEFVLGIVTLVLVPPGRPSGLLPARWASVYLAHAIVGLPLAFGAVAALALVRESTRLSRLSGWIGAVGVAVAGAGGVLTVAHPLRLAGMALMLVGSLVAGFGYLIPTFEKLS